MTICADCRQPTGRAPQALRCLPCSIREEAARTRRARHGLPVMAKVCVDCRELTGRAPGARRCWECADRRMRTRWTRQNAARALVHRTAS